jgi:hypothetical protein
VNAKPRVVLTRGEKTGWFIIGFLGWFLINGVLGSMVAAVASLAYDWAPTAAVIISALLVGANPVALIVLAFFPRGQWAALGALAALTVAFCVVLILGATLAAICFGALGQGNL